MQRVIRLVVMGAVLCTFACGGGSSGSAGMGGLNVRALWQQSDGPVWGARQRAQRGGFGPELPAAVNTVTVTFESASGVRHCVAVDPRRVPIDPASGQRLLVLRSLPAGPGTVTIFGYATDLQNVGSACERVRFATPSFRSEPASVLIIGGERTDAGDIDVFAVPFLIRQHPAPADLPERVPTADLLTFDVVDAVSSIDPESIHVEITQDGTGEPFLPPPTECNDATANPCSDRGELQVSGFHLAQPLNVLHAGAATLHVVATNLALPAQTLDVTYDFVIVSADVTPSVTPTSTPQVTPSGTPTETPPPLATSTATPTPTTETPPTGMLTGTVINCLTGLPLSATVDLLTPVSQETHALSDGLFRFSDIPLGDFRVRATADGFITAEITGTLDATTPSRDVRLALCPIQATGLRVVLTWGSEPPAPPDLDAHLRGPAAGTSVAGQPVEFHVYYRSTSISFPGGGEAHLDIDNTNFSGPETETVSVLSSGTYAFCVHDFTNQTELQSTGLASSSAQVQLFVANEQIATFTVPSGVGTVWEVFRFDTTQQPPALVAVNTLTNEEDADRVCRRADDDDGDGLTNQQEAVLGTDPNVFDTNSNGLSDGDDVINGNNPRATALVAEELQRR